MRSALLAQFIGLAACGNADRAAPLVVGAVAVPGYELGLADPRSPLAGRMVETETRPTIALLFSERLDGDAIEEVVTNADTGAVTELVGRDGIIRIAPVDGSVVGEAIAYHPEDRAIRVLPSAHLPAGTAVLIHLMADRVWDTHGNVVPPARTADGESVQDVDGRDIAATVAFMTEPIALLEAEVPTYGTTDNPDTELDETVPYDAAITLEFNTAVAPATVVANIAPLGGDPIPVVATTGDTSTHIHLTPLAPLAPATGYELRIDRAADLYGVRWNGSPRLVTFSTR